MDDVNRAVRLAWQSTAALAVTCALAAIIPPGGAGAASPSASLEQAVKASFLFKFAPFVSWPQSAQSGAFTICLRGEDPFGNTLDEVVRGQRISGRTVNVRRLADSGSINGCQMLFAGRSSADSYMPFAGAAGQPVLTVSDQKSGVQGAMIEFVMLNGRVRFQIDEVTARANGLAISSKLLGMAVSVDRK